MNKLINKPPFTEDDEVIIENLSIFGKQWTKITQYLNGRTGNQVKNRWNSALNKKYRLSFTEIPKAPQSLFPKKRSSFYEPFRITKIPQILVILFGIFATANFLITLESLHS